MSIQIIFCLETNDKAETDYVYVKETLNRFYDISNQVKINKVCMNGKTNFNSDTVLNKIKQLTREYSRVGETKIIYCIDTDAIESDFDRVKELNKIQDFCKKSQYEFVWFCHDIEEVYLGRKIPKKEKVKEAGRFRKHNMIQDIQFEQLSRGEIRSLTSNIMLILDKYIERKA